MATSYGFDTLQVHAGARPDPATGARQVPIYQTTAYVFRDADHAAKLFNLQEVGYIYSRLTNPTVSALANRVVALEGGAGGIACSSGHAAQIMALFPIMAARPQRRRLDQALWRHDPAVLQHDPQVRLVCQVRRFRRPGKAIEAAIDADTRALFCETICNPGGAHQRPADAIARVANQAHVFR